MREELSLEMRGLVDRARRDEIPANAGLKRRVRHAVSLAIPSSAILGSGLAAASGNATNAGTGAALGMAAIGKASTGLLNGFLVWVAGGFAIGIGAMTAYVGWGSGKIDPHAQPAVGAATLSTLRRPVETPRPMAAATTPNRTAATIPAQSSSALVNNAAIVPGQTPTDIRQATSLADEVALLARVQQQLRDGQGQAALETVDQAAHRFAQSQLEPDFQAARVLAWCELGQTTQARQAAAAFLRVHGGSPLAERVRSSCASSDSTQEPSTTERPSNAD
jgi:hypothetical protein